MKSLVAIAALAIVSCGSDPVPVVVPTVTPVVIEKIVEKRVYSNILGLSFREIEGMAFVEIGYDTNGNGVPDLYERRAFSVVGDFMYFSDPVKIEYDLDENGEVDEESGLN